MLWSSAAFAQLAQQDYGWDIYGDRYALPAREYSDISNFFVMEGPGNLNPGNLYDLNQDDTNLRIPSELKAYIARQFKYVLFDQESFCDRAGRNGPPASLMTALYHQEAESLMNRSSSIIVLPYLSFTLMRYQYPWRASAPEAWYLHQAGQPADSAHRIRAAESGFFLMDVSNARWRGFFRDYIVGIRNAHNYRGIFLDNMTRYPWVDSTDYAYLPAGVFDGWLNNLVTFVNELNAALGSSVVICNSLGIDGDNALPLFGPNHGKDLMPFVAGGAQFESFHSTAWRSVLDTTLAMMKYMQESNKILLAATHYYRGQDDDQVREDILPSRFGLEPATGWLSTTVDWPRLKDLYRMQMSYLARYLLVTPSAGQPAFGYSFQPGVLLYQFIPYYKPWDERIGTPVDQNYVDAGSYYKREFSNALAIVNTTESMNTITIPSAAWYWYPYPNWDPANGNNIPDERYTPNTVTLNKMEGIVLFKKVQGDQ